MEDFKLKNLNDVEAKEQYQVKFSNIFAALMKMMMIMWTSIGFGTVEVI
jgi:hypothetical protein